MVTILDTSGWQHRPWKGAAVLDQGICPVCGGRFASPLNHAARKHGISGRDMRLAVGLPLKKSVIDPALAARYARNGHANRGNLSRSSHQ